MFTVTGTGRSALSNTDLPDAVRKHNLNAFRQAWKRFEEAVTGSVKLVPQAKLRAVIERKRVTRAAFRENMGVANGGWLA